jgi:hypothetical protein
MAKGHKTGGGSRAGKPNKSTLAIKERLAQMNCDYVAYLANTVNNQLPCTVCRGAGKTKFQPRGGERFSGERTCQSCWGSGLEKVSPELGNKAATTLMEYCEAKRKPVDKDGSSDDNLHVGIRVVLVKAGESKDAG